jgi:hypothetical protein
MDDAADHYYTKWNKQMRVLEKSVLAKVRKGISASDVYALGKQLDQFEAYLELCEEEGSTNQLGQLPKVAYDVITAVHGVSILPVVASVQPIDEERGNVYFKDIRSATTKGTQTAGETVVDPRTGVVTPAGYASNFISAEVIATTPGSSPPTSYSGTLAAAPARTETIQITVQGTPAVFAQDDGNGNLLGVGVSGTINYVSGAFTLNFAVAPAINTQIYASYQQNYELSTDIPQIDTFFNSVGIQARIYALKGTIGMLQSFGMRKRFGLVAEDEIAKDLVQEVNREIGGDLIRGLAASAIGLTTFSRTPPSTSISFFEHKQTYKDSLASSEAVLVGNAGRGTISLLIVGKNHAALISSLPGWKKLYDGHALGAHVFGELDGIPVVRVIETSILPVDYGLAVWKGGSPFEAAAVYSPFMPLAVTSTLPQAPNPLNSMKAAAVWAGVQTLVPQYVTAFNVVP